VILQQYILDTDTVTGPSGSGSGKHREQRPFWEITYLHGSHYSVDLEVTGLQGHPAVVRTGWLVTSGSDDAWLTTLYVRKR